MTAAASNVTEAGGQHIGAPALRREDDRLLRGAGRFVDDVDLVGQLAARFVRSPVAHGRIENIDATGALAMAGVIAVFTAADLGDMGPLRPRWHVDEYDLSPYLQPALAREYVRYVGEPIAVVVATSDYVAEDAADNVFVGIEALPAVTHPVRALEPGASALWAGGNEVTEIVRSWGNVDDAFASATHRVKADLSTGRQAGVPLETRGCLASYDAGRDKLWIRGPLNPASHRGPLARLLGMAESSLHLEQDDIGGNFGSRAGIYPEHVIIPFLARKLDRPVKWVEDRAEHMVATSHAREQIHEIEAAFDSDGRLLAIRDEIWHDIGAYVRPQGLIASEITVGMMCAPYRLDAYAGTIHVVATNKTPLCPYRGPGRFEGTFVRERLLDIAANRIGLDPAELRRRNLLKPEDLPFEPGYEILGAPYRLADMDVPDALARALAASGYSNWTEELNDLRRAGRHVGVGLGIGVDKSGMGRYETGAVRVDRSGRVGVVTGGFSVGQGVETVLAQIAADELGVDPSDVDVTYGDTEVDPYGVGSFSSRTTVLGGSAVLIAARKTAERARELAGAALEAAPDDVVLADGRAFVRGVPGKGIALADLAAAADPISAAEAGNEPGLGAQHVFVAEHQNYPYSITLAQVEIEPDTGSVCVRRLFVASEVGRAINPRLVEGQLVGAAAQGVGAALLEELVYDDDGQPLATTFMDYLLPTAAELPRIGTLVLEDAPQPDNPLGAKGAGETGGLGVGAAVANAISDALGGDEAIAALPVRPGLVVERLQRRVTA